MPLKDDGHNAYFSQVLIPTGVFNFTGKAYPKRPILITGFGLVMVCCMAATFVSALLPHTMKLLLPAICAIPLLVLRHFTITAADRLVVRVTTISILIYFVLQSPVGFERWHDVILLSLPAPEALYVGAKILIAVTLLYLLWKNDKSMVLAAFILLTIYAIDNEIIKFLNFGISKTSTEWITIWEAFYLYCFMLLLINFIFNRRLTTGSDQEMNSDQEAPNIVHIPMILYACMHVANYAAAGVAKVSLDPYLLWLQNETLLNFYKSATWGLGVQVFEPLVGFINNSFVDFFGNIAVLTSQLMSILVPIFPVIFAPLVLAYDVFHIAVGCVVGVWFYKWIVVNSVLFLIRRQVQEALTSLSLTWRITLGLYILILSQSNAYIPLGWFDMRQGSFISYEVLLKSGETKKLAPSVFGSAAFPMGHKMIHMFDKNLGRPLWGTLSIERWKKGNDCELQLIPTKTKRQQISKDRVRKIVQTTFRKETNFQVAMHNIQPYHQVLPFTGKQNYLTLSLAKQALAVRASLNVFCFDREGTLISLDTVDTMEFKIAE